MQEQEGVGAGYGKDFLFGHDDRGGAAVRAPVADQRAVEPFRWRVGREFPFIPWRYAPAWQLVGGLFGATVVFNTILCVPHIGVLPTLMAMILGNLIMGCIIDHFGWFGIPVNLFTWRRFLGVLLVLLGLFIAFRR